MIIECLPNKPNILKQATQNKSAIQKKNVANMNVKKEKQIFSPK